MSRWSWWLLLIRSNTCTSAAKKQLQHPVHANMHRNVNKQNVCKDAGEMTVRKGRIAGGSSRNCAAESLKARKSVIAVDFAVKDGHSTSLQSLVMSLNSTVYTASHCNHIICTISEILALVCELEAT